MTDPFIRPDVRQLLEFLENLPGPKSHEVGPEGARQMMIAGRYALDAPHLPGDILHARPTLW